MVGVPSSSPAGSASTSRGPLINSPSPSSARKSTASSSDSRGCLTNRRVAPTPGLPAPKDPGLTPPDPASPVIALPPLPARLCPALAPASLPPVPALARQTRALRTAAPGALPPPPAHSADGVPKTTPQTTGSRSTAHQTSPRSRCQFTTCAQPASTPQANPSELDPGCHTAPRAPRTVSLAHRWPSTPLAQRTPGPVAFLIRRRLGSPPVAFSADHDHTACGSQPHPWRWAGRTAIRCTGGSHRPRPSLCATRCRRDWSATSASFKSALRNSATRRGRE